MLMQRDLKQGFCFEEEINLGKNNSNLNDFLGSILRICVANKTNGLKKVLKPRNTGGLPESGPAFWEVSRSETLTVTLPIMGSGWQFSLGLPNCTEIKQVKAKVISKMFSSLVFLRGLLKAPNELEPLGAVKWCKRFSFKMSQLISIA